MGSIIWNVPFGGRVHYSEDTEMSKWASLYIIKPQESPTRVLPSAVICISTGKGNVNFCVCTQETEFSGDTLFPECQRPVFSKLKCKVTIARRLLCLRREIFKHQRNRHKGFPYGSIKENISQLNMSMEEPWLSLEGVCKFRWMAALFRLFIKTFRKLTWLSKCALFFCFL